MNAPVVTSHLVFAKVNTKAFQKSVHIKLIVLRLDLTLYKESYVSSLSHHKEMYVK